jgi:two-component system, NtrC family, sensor kinase
MLEKALRLCNAAFGAMVTLEDDVVQIRAQRNLPQQFLEFLRQELSEFRPDTLIGHAMLTRSVVHVADITVGEPFRRGAPLAIAAAELAGIRTMLFVPLVKDDAGLGVLTV